jgi:hypothetical protein
MRTTSDATQEISGRAYGYGGISDDGSISVM